MVSVDAARTKSEEEWLADLSRLRVEAKERFGDVAWVAEGSQRLVYAHKCIVYARATGNWQQRFMGLPHSLSESATSSFGHSTTSLRTWTPQSLVRRDSTATQNFATPSSCSSPAPSDLSHTSSTSNSSLIRPIVLGSTDLDVFETSLEYFYTGGREAEAFAVVLEGFNEGGGPAEGELTGTAKLRQDLHFCWRSKLFADVDIVLESPDGTLSTPFSAHRAILASRSSYFKSLLLGDYSDSRLDRFTLPSPPFTPPSLVFVLGYMYTGTLDFSNRTFNLETVFETWRCAAFLSMSTLQDELEVKIVSMITPQRAPRIYQFAHASDVNSAVLARSTLPVIIDHFDEMWATPYIGTLDYDPQMELVTKLRSTITPLTVAKVSRQTRKLRKKLEIERAGWSRNVEAMLEAVERRLVTIIANQLPEIVVSPGFVDLVDGVGFSSDVLEWLLLQVFDKDELREKNAPLAYQALVGSVLLREQGIMVDARMHVEDTRNGLLKYIKTRWAMIRDEGGFDRLEPWCLKELADELEVSTKELLAGDRTISNRKSPPKRLTERPVATARPRASEPVISNRTAATTALPRQSLPTRTPRLSTASTASRSSISSLAPRAPPVRSASGTRPPPVATTNARSPLASTTPRPPIRSPAISQTGAPPSTAPSVRARTRTTSANSVAPSTSRRPLSPSPSVATVRNTAVRSPAGGTDRTTAPSRTTSTSSIARQTPPVRPSPSTSSIPRTRTTSGPAPSTRIRTQPSATSIRSTTSTKSPATRPPSSASVANSTAVTPRSRASSTTSTRRPSNASTKPALPTSTSRSSIRPSRAVPNVPPLPSSASGTVRARTSSKLKSKPPGTSLLSGIPCIVTVKGTRPIRMRAMVRYLGSLVGETGQWVGVEIPEDTIPVEAKKLSWNDGKKGEVEYFSLTPPSAPASTSTSAPSTSPSSPIPSDPPAATVPTRNDSLQPPTIGRQPRRRSTSAEPPLPTGPTKGLFVRPSQIVYVL
ncbi:uncharacterized protein JCM6883_006443 [Sporobolomyces salmoneus]|uniref:uncharacterized protein n=1 Tax=Sporobolomyces salmoneus TaxID=183962 RepID=UPI00317F4370